ncbi:hypothetical protein NU08_4085 [Flavobacterium anhuiense]|uniref:Uncharacterized protein n=1 Tax=Flavobacterium anhuiense TaxID=459526 RepID=A0A444VTS1_9FLAO|nr:hypothetical protein NU08_4085 [Flavobacterium anhuiense]
MIKSEKNKKTGKVTYLTNAYLKTIIIKILFGKSNIFSINTRKDI